MAIEHTPRRIRAMPVNMGLLLDVFRAMQRGEHIGIEGIPADALVVGVLPSRYSPHDVDVYVESATFGDVVEGAIPERLYVTFHEMGRR